MTAMNSGAYCLLEADARGQVDRLLAETAANGGLAPCDVEQFWRDQAVAAENPFGENITQVPLGAICNWECVFDELGIDVDFWRYQYGEPEWAQEINKRYNELAERIVGRRLLPETQSDPARKWPEVKQLYDIFEAENVWEGGATGSWWLKQSAGNNEELSALLDRVEVRLDSLRDFMLPENWDEEKARLKALGVSPLLYRSQRGPCTFACSVFGIENMLLLYYDDPELFVRFSAVLRRAILARARLLDEEAGFTTANAPRGWRWYDDNCCLFTPDMYEAFAAPILQAVFSEYAPGKNDLRYQHSDSAMAHLLPQLGALGINGTNFGPDLSVAEIRRNCPDAVIEGQLAPFTFSRNEEANMVAEFLRDFAQARKQRGLVFTTAGSINNGSRLSGMRLLMAAIQRYGRYA